MKTEKYSIANEMFLNLHTESAARTKLSLALAYLDKAANILDNMQNSKSSEEVTQVIENLAKLK